MFLLRSPPPLYYNSQNALQGGQTDALPLSGRFGEAFPTPAVSHPRLNFWGLYVSGKHCVEGILTF